MQKSTKQKSKNQPLFYFVKNQKSKKHPKDAAKKHKILKVIKRISPILKIG